MTTVAYRDGVIATDSRSIVGMGILSDNSTKLHRMADGTRIAGAGDAIKMMSFVNSIKGGAPDYSKLGYGSCAFVLKPNGNIYWCDQSGDLPLDKSQFYAMGSGAQAALAAMHMGASAVEAVAIAKRIDPNTGGRIQKYILKAMQTAFGDG